MNITIKRSGGITGLRPTMTIDTSQLIADEAKYVEGIIAKLPEYPAKKAPGADRFSYRIVVEEDGKEPREHYLGEGQNSPLIGALFAAAKHTAEAVQREMQKDG